MIGWSLAGALNSPSGSLALLYPQDQQYNSRDSQSATQSIPDSLHGPSFTSYPLGASPTQYSGIFNPLSANVSAEFDGTGQCVEPTTGQHGNVGVFPPHDATGSSVRHGTNAAQTIVETPPELPPPETDPNYGMAYGEYAIATSNVDVSALWDEYPAWLNYS